jgi:hypothetical protein
MTRLIVGFLSWTVLSCATLVTDSTYAASRQKKVNACVAAPEQPCDPFAIAYCVSRNACGGCAKWACKAWLLPPVMMR